MQVNLTGGPCGGITVTVPDDVVEFAINIDSVPVYSSTGQFIGLDKNYAGQKYQSTEIDTFVNKRLSLWEDIKFKRDHLQASGVKVGNYWFHSDTSSRIQQLGLVMMGSNIPPGLMWKTMSGELVVMTQTLAMQIFMAQAAQDMTLFAVAENKRREMMLVQDPTSYDYESGWPETFTG